MIKYILGVAALVAGCLATLPVQAAGQEILTRDICVDSPAGYKEIIETHKEQGFIVAQTKFWEIMLDPKSDCYAVPGGGRIAVIVLETLQKDDLRDMNGVSKCVTLYRVKLEGQVDPTEEIFTVAFINGMCNKNSI